MHLDDIDEVYAIELAVHKTPWSRKILIDCVEIGYDCRVLVHKKQIIGFIISRLSLDVCHIFNLAIAKTEQGKGYGKLLLTDLLHSLAAKLTQTITITLEVRVSNTIAQALYESLGFHCVSQKEGYYQDVAGKEDALVLEKMVNY